MDGIIIVNKKVGVTSFDVIRDLRKILHIRRIGHTGTLDPLASGVLIVCVGKATRLAQDIENSIKSYVALFDLGYSTNTYDKEGEIVTKVDTFNVTREKLESTLTHFRGKISQVPPMFSAIKIDGQKMYELARKGIHHELPPREVEISKLEITEFDGKSGTLMCTVSKGTYIRSLVYDIGETLGVHATMTGLTRTSVGNTDISQSYTIEEISQMAENKDFSFIHTVEDFFDYDSIALTSEKDKKLFANGNTIIYNAKDGLYKVYADNKFIGLCSVHNSHLKGYKYF